MDGEREREPCQSPYVCICLVGKERHRCQQSHNCPIFRLQIITPRVSSFQQKMWVKLLLATHNCRKELFRLATIRTVFHESSQHFWHFTWLQELWLFYWYMYVWYPLLFCRIQVCSHNAPSYFILFFLQGSISVGWVVWDRVTGTRIHVQLC